MAHRLKLVSFELCPYVERSRIVLLEKGVPHDVEFIDLANKPPGFLAISPMGRVPVLLVDDRPIFESMVINELLEELHPEPPLLPKDPIARAEARGWIVFANDVLFPASFQAMLAIAAAGAGAPAPAIAEPLSRVADGFAKVEDHLARRRAPNAGRFFGGDALSLVDAAYAPFLRRWRQVELWGREEAIFFPRLPATAAWARTLLDHASVRAAEPPGFGPRLRETFEKRARERAPAR
jgi:glutathione S-transferase